MKNPLSLEEDFYIEVKPRTSSSYVPQTPEEIQEDIDYVIMSLRRAIKIPAEFLNKPKP